MSKKTTIGGQALIEGIMMKGPLKTVLSVRTPDGEIVTEEIKDSKQLPKILKVPVVRGVANFVVSMLQGYKALMRSADLSGMTELEDAEEKEKAAEKRAKKAKKLAEKQGLDEEQTLLLMKEAREKEPPKNDGALMGIVMTVASVLGVALSVFLFMYLPSFLFDLLNGAFSGAIVSIKSLFEGVVKILIFLCYLILVSRMKDIRRVFMYHGAEHKTIFCYESGEELNVENVRKQSRLHPRCGTSFLIIMLVVGVLVSFILTLIFPALTAAENRLVWVLVKIVSVPVICGLAYELIRICGRYDNVVTCAVSAPGKWLQKITTVEPDDKMIEVAITALTAVIPEDEELDRW